MGEIINLPESEKVLKFYQKSVYGKVLTYPSDQIAPFIQKLIGAKTISEGQLEALRNLGLAVVVVRLPTANSVLNVIKQAQVAIEAAKKNNKVPKKVKEIARAIERDIDASPEKAYRIGWEQYCSYINPDYQGCTSKGKSKRKSPKKDYVKATDVREKLINRILKHPENLLELSQLNEISNFELAEILKEYNEALFTVVENNQHEPQEELLFDLDDLLGN
jgi:gas vesicle protein